jgi:hypothetical protein
MTVSWKLGGLLLGIVFFAAILLVKPIGVSTQFVVLDGVIADIINPDTIVEGAEGPSSPVSYFNKYAKDIANPWNYGFVFVVAMAIGAGLSAAARGGFGGEGPVPALWRANFGPSPWKRYTGALLGGAIVVFGARLAGGCTSGHMMSGMGQTSVSGFLFSAGTFLTAIPVALMLYKHED